MEDRAAALIGVMLFAIPIVAIVGGIVAGIMRTMGRNRLIELAQKERIAAIERGIDPAKLPPLPSFADEGERSAPGQDARRRSQGLMIAGLIALALGASLAPVIHYANPGEPGWAGGIVVGAVGLALIVSSFVVRPRNGD